MFTITDAAVAAIESQLQQLGAGIYLPAIVWAADKNGREAWEVGYHKRVDVRQDFVVAVNGLEIVIEPHWRDELESKTLDIVNGYFRVRPQK
jgi:hypothetical protein